MGHKLEVIFSKMGDMRFVSHLDLMRLFQRASRRANLAVEITKGFSPHLKISILKALKLGLESQGEKALFSMAERTGPDLFMQSINKKLPEGIRVLSAKEVE